MIIAGIDIGVHGAIAILHVGERRPTVEVHDMPILHDGPVTKAGKRRATINGPLLAAIMAQSHADHAYVEHVAARPGEGAVGAFSFGRCRGIIEGVCAGLSIPVTFLTPAVWKKLVHLPAGKEDAKEAARSKAKIGRAHV